MINWFNSNNSLVKDYSKLKTKFSLVQITTVLIVFSLFTLLFFFFFQNSIKTNSFIEPIFFFIFIITFIYSIAVKNSLVANFNMVITKISNTFNIKTGRILNNNKIILRSMLQKWYFLLFLLIVINPLIYANLVEINHFSNQYPYMYKISDRYYEGVTENQSKLLDNAPNVVNSTIIELIYYFGTFSLGNKNLKQFFTIYVLNFKKIAQLLPKKTLNYLDPSLKKLLVNGLDNGPYGIFSNPLSSNLQLKGGSILNLESNLNITYDRTFSYFPGILTSNWIILDKTNKFFNYTEILQNNQPITYDWIGKIKNPTNFDVWVKSNLGYMKERTLNYSELTSFFNYLKIQLFSFITDNSQVLFLLFYFIEVLTFIVFLILTFSINNLFVKSIDMFLLRGSSKRILEGVFIKDIIQ